MSTEETKLVPIQMSGGMAMLFDQAMFVRAQTISKLYANCSMVPDHFKGQMENCFIALQIAVRTGQDPFMLMQNMYIVHGRPGFESKYLIGRLNASGKIKGFVRYEFTGEKGSDDYGCAAYVTDADTGDRVEGPKVDWAMVKGEGWNKDKGGQNGKPIVKSKWSTMGDLMFRYRAAAFLIRTTFPEVMMGMQTKEELEDSTIDVQFKAERAPGKLDELLTDAPLQVESTESETGEAVELPQEAAPVATEKTQDQATLEAFDALEIAIKDVKSEGEFAGMRAWIRKLAVTDTIKAELRRRCDEAERLFKSKGQRELV